MSIARSAVPAPEPKALPVAKEDVGSFSIIGGGPLFRFIRRMHMSSENLQFLPRRILLAFILTWVPVAILSANAGRAWRGSVSLPFFLDIDLQVRLLVALPVLLLAEVVAFRFLKPIIPAFLGRRLISEADRPKFDAAVASTERLRDSSLAEILLILFVYGFGVSYLWRTHLAMAGASWYSIPDGAGRRTTAAGWWYALVSLPLWQFLLVRWYYRLVLWARLLWKISRLDLQLVLTHPDRSGGLGFISLSYRAFSTFVVAHGTLVAGAIANRIFFEGAKLLDFKVLLGAYAVLMILIVAGPTLVFAPALAAARRKALGEYGDFAERYVRSFDRKWLRSGSTPGDAHLGSPDIQSLADLANSYELVVRTRVIPFDRRVLTNLAVAALLPIAPLVLTVIPLDTLLKTLLKMIF